jgi:hypothetical protein
MENFGLCDMKNQDYHAYIAHGALLKNIDRGRALSHDQMLPPALNE